LRVFLLKRSMPIEPTVITREHVEAFVTDLLERRSLPRPTTATAIDDADEAAAPPRGRRPFGSPATRTVSGSRHPRL
jgi:hypothetical protein